jgi:phosphoglycolate phosphatase
MGFKAVLFDMDGTVIDSVPAWHRTFNMTREHLGHDPVTYERFCSDILGQSSDADIELFFPGLSVNELIGFYESFFRENIYMVSLFPETAGVMDWIRGHGLRTALVTNTPSDLMAEVVGRLGINGFFDELIGGTDVSIGKPDPEMIRLACERLQVKPRQAIMVGDTQADNLSGKAAGCVTVGIKTRADHEINGLDELIALLERIMS